MNNVFTLIKIMFSKHNFDTKFEIQVLKIVGGEWSSKDLLKAKLPQWAGF